nr:immunoglobulin light chain junction region [Macaca mulatta]MOY07284.1 immunoglobulin light chain junction region [Macaca mulatta]MOY07753.1 immunoglobulin light chain junction region [Macaca mulatta]MOY07955.1 immunoglobulin light chain junction region [Macaca mulatta]MOY08128.1 immunoglobulin light chain junction region [Macaca mulatta]
DYYCQSSDSSGNYPVF